MQEQYKEYDEELLKNEFLNKHWECLPYIGERYKETHLLLIGESHYVSENDIKYVNLTDFYDIPFDDLEGEDYKTWINTRSVYERRVYYHKELKHFFYNPAVEIAKIVNQTEVLSKEQIYDAMHRYAFMNYYKRPSFEKGKTIRGLTEKDFIMAYDVSSFIIEILKPKLIVFISQKAYKAFCNYDNNNLRIKYTIKSVSHPSSCWWNRRRKDDGCAREDFSKYLKESL